MKTNLYPAFNIYDFSDCREITGDELYSINGGAQIENTNEAVAGAQVGDTLIRDDGTEVTITQGDIDWAQAHTGTGGTDPSQATPATSESTPESQPSTPTNSSSITGATSSANTSNPSSSSGSLDNNSSLKSETKVPVFTDPFSPESNGNFEIDNKNKTVSADINNAQSVIEACKSYSILVDRGYLFQLKDGEKIVQTITDEKVVNDYARKIDISKGNFSIAKLSGTISTVSGVTSELLNKTIENSGDLLKISIIGKFSKTLDNVSNITGTYTVIYTAFDKVGNYSEKERTITVKDIQGSTYYRYRTSTTESYQCEPYNCSCDITNTNTCPSTRTFVEPNQCCKTCYKTCKNVVWSEWSEWSQEKVTPNATTEVETKIE